MIVTGDLIFFYIAGCTFFIGLLLAVAIDDFSRKKLLSCVVSLVIAGVLSFELCFLIHEVQLLSDALAR